MAWEGYSGAKLGDALAVKKLRVSAEGKGFEIQFSKTIAMGDIVLVVSKVTDPPVEGDLGVGYVDIFRLNGEGLFVEHWDIEEPQTGESAN